MGFTFILMSLWGATAHAFPTGLARCPDHEVNPGFQKNADLIHKAAMVGLETRLTRKEFAQLKRRSPRQSLKDALKEVDARHSATGFLNCGGSWMGAILIGKNGLVTAPGHAFFNKADCSPKSQPPGAACRVMFPLTGSERTYPIKLNTVVTGYCKAQTDANWSKYDWAVFEIEGPIAGATPYAVPDVDSKMRDPEPGRPIKILQVAGSAVNFNSSEPRPTMKSYYNFEYCHVVDRYVHPNQPLQNQPLQTDCDTGGGASGAAHLIETDDGKVVLNAMNVAERSNLRNPENPNDSRPDSSNYIKDKHYNVSVPLEGEFLRAIHEKMGTRVSSGQ